MNIKNTIRQVILNCFDERIIKEELFEAISAEYGFDIAEKAVDEDAEHYIEEMIAAIDRRFAEIEIEEKSMEVNKNV